ncbi:hypothetical protein [Kutzneria buriramensis]|uniref:Uncharacterized protein n=1 Tax=Kutzneria buriramensis TaxID=1045776 RepID=A0A3E0HEC4_9PSEU|nr:hypothetical protein [Kutzneria buriramensis]REH43624.1 hypothetical protein BCF44_109167 [Kutzneria buriramensis]
MSWYGRTCSGCGRNVAAREPEGVGTVLCTTCHKGDLPFTVVRADPEPLLPTPAAAGDLYEQLVHLAEILHVFDAPYFDQIKLTQQQLDAVRARFPPESPNPELNPAAWLTGIPIVLVDTVEESTPYERGWLP